MPNGETMAAVLAVLLLQLPIQVYCIRHCWKREDLSQRQKLAYACGMALGSLPAAAVYLFRTRERIRVRNSDFSNVAVDENVRLGIFVLLFMALAIFTVRLLIDNYGQPSFIPLFVLLSYCAAITAIDQLLVRASHRSLYHLLPATQLLLAIPLQYLDDTYTAQYILMTVTAGIINKFPLPLAKTYAIAAFCAFLAGSTAKAWRHLSSLDPGDIVGFLYVNTLVFLLITVAFYMLKRQLLTNRQLDAALRRVNEQSEQIAAMGAMEERNRIAAEIHDRVGHTLTSAAISIEAAEALMAANDPGAAAKMSMAKEQVKRSLEDIRDSVRTMRSGDEPLFPQALDSILDSIRRATGLAVRSVIEVRSTLLPVQQGILLLAIRECATNALKHGRSTEADILVQEHSGRICMTFSDNGTGATAFTPGTGLSIMKERVESIGGTLRLDSAEGEGFIVEVALPIGVAGGEIQ